MRVSLRLIGPMVVALLLLPRAASAQQALPPDSLALARRFAELFYAGEVDSLVARLSPESLEALGGRDGLISSIAQVSTRAGDEVSVVEERWNLRNGLRQYWRTSKMTQFPQDFLLRVNLGADGKVIGLGLGPASGAPPVEAVGPPIPRP